MKTSTKQKRKRIGLKEVRASFNHTKGREMPASAVWLGRPLADWATPFFYNVGMTANGVTLLRTILTLISLALLCTGKQEMLYAAGLVGLFAFVLDFVDGHLARLDDNASYWGKYSDGLSDYLFPGFGLFAAGFGLTLQTGNLWFLGAGGIVSLVALMTRTARDRLRYFQQWMVEQSGPVTEAETQSAQPWKRMEYHISVAAANGRTIAFFLLFIPDGGMLFFSFLLLVQGLSEPAWLFVCLKTGQTTLNRWRKSVHASSG